MQTSLAHVCFVHVSGEGYYTKLQSPMKVLQHLLLRLRWSDREIYSLFKALQWKNYFKSHC